MKHQAVPTDEARGLAGFALGDVGRGVYMANIRMC